MNKCFSSTLSYVRDVDSISRALFENIFVYGHSLDVTDKDILELFLKPDYSSLVVYVKGDVNEGKLISNMIKIMTEDVLIKKATGFPSRLETRVI